MLEVVSKQLAVETVLEKTAAAALPTQMLALAQACGRVLAQDIISAENIPPFHRTTVDGYAVCAADTFGASESLPAQLNIVGEILMGERPAFALRRGQCAKISTGGMLPQGADAAIMVEHTDEADGLCLAYKSVSPFENVSKAGDDIAAGEVAAAAYTHIKPAHIGIFSALGIDSVPVLQKPVIAIISTGDEISAAPKAGQIRDINTHLLASAAEASGCTALCYGVVKDDAAQITAALKTCLSKADAVLISGGSSAGTRDMTVDILASLGEVYFHGIAMKPGKPTIFGIAEGKAVFGLPGHPLAAFFVWKLIVLPFILQLLRQPQPAAIFTAPTAQNIPSNHGREEYLCVKRVGSSIVPLHTKSGIISVLSLADGYIQIGRDTEGIQAGTPLEVYQL